ncbi:MAG: AraC family transcriptional regulator [Eubacterium sp.]|nr:AraC family transcriptional regulator [Eubacterium sp.]
MSNIANNYWKFYNKDLPLNVMVIGNSVCDSSYHVKRRKSHIIAIEYIKKGSQTLFINSKEYQSEKNSAILLTKNSNHEYFCDSEIPLEKEWIVFDGELAEYFVKTYVSENEYCFKDCNLLHFFEEINRIKKHSENDYEKLTDNIAVILHKMFIQIKNSQRKNDSTIPEQIQHYLDENIEKKISINDLCQTFSYSKNQIIKMFRDYYGVTPYHYFLERKIDIAKLYLCNTKYSINEISCMLAFSDQNYFSTQFRHITGMSPAEYRKLNN